MAYVKFSNIQKDFVIVPYWFISEYMPKAPYGHIKVYLYLLSESHTTQSALVLEDVAAKLEMLYSELLIALKDLDKQGILSFKELPEDSFELAFPFEKPIKQIETAPLPIAKTSIQQTRPNYSLAELNIYKTQDDSISKLFMLSEEYLGRLLSPSDQQILFGLYDWLHLPIDLIEYIIEFCASNNHTNLRYIEKVAIGWVDNGITTLAAAKHKMNFDKRYTTILSELGLSSQVITKVQKDFIDKWLDSYHLSMAIILEGCKRTMAQTKNPSLKYLDSILTSWSKTNVKSLDDIADLDKAYASSNNKFPSTAPKIAKATKNQKFTSTYSHNWDFDQLEQLEQQYIERKLNGGN